MDKDLVALKGPEGATSTSVDGVQYDADEKGVFRVAASIVGHLAQFGFVQNTDTASTTDGAEQAQAEAPAAPASTGKKKAAAAAAAAAADTASTTDGAEQA